jgi:AraC family transcriptional regulator
MKAEMTYSPRSLQSTLAEPGRTLFTSVAAGWQSLLLQVVEAPGCVESFQSVATPDHLIVLVLRGTYEIESVSSRSSGSATYRRGRGGMTAPMNTSHLRWRSEHKSLQTLHLYIPHSYFQEAQEEERRPFSGVSGGLPDGLGFDDPLIFAVGMSLMEQAKLGAPDFYAEGAARFLAAHLVRPVGQDQNDSAQPHIHDARLRRVLEYIEHHFADQLSLEDLAREAAISTFHFARLFRAKVGRSPARYIVEKRLLHARSLLLETDKPIGEVLLECGYSHQSHFAAAFAKRFGVTPLTFRLTRRSS